MDSKSGRSVEEMLAYRYTVYDLLRRIFLWQFPLELFTNLVKASEGEQTGSTPACSPEAAFQAYLRTLRDKDLVEQHRELHIEYTRLFVGPRHLPSPPYESVYRSSEQLMMQDETIDVRVFYAKSGFRVARMHQEPDDSVGNELEFLCAMSKRTLDAFCANDRAAAANLIVTQRQFLEKHLSRWMPHFCRDVAENTKSEFWKGVAGFTAGFVAEDAAVLEALWNEVGSGPNPGTANVSADVVH